MAARHPARTLKLFLTYCPVGRSPRGAAAPAPRWTRHVRSLIRRSSAVLRRRPRVTAAALGAVVLLAVAGGVTALREDGAPPAPVAGPTFTYAGTWNLLELQRHIEAGDVVAVTTADGGTGQDVADDRLAAKTTSGQVIEVRLDVTPAQAVDALVSLGHRDLLTSEAWASVRRSAAQASGSGDPLRSIAAIAFPLAMVVLLGLILIRTIGRPGRSRDRRSTFTTILPAEQSVAAGADAVARVRLADVAGCDEAKLELTETIEFLRSPARFGRLGARIPHGILLYGPPGTGKTMLARAVAAEAGVPFLYASGSEFVEKYVGVGARRVRDLFAQARRLGRAVVFFDEFDALGKARGGQNSHEEREQTLNQLLVELDGFGSTDDIVVIAATNRLDVLDPAVLRPGRFNRKIHVGLPDVQGRREILAVHARGKPLSATADLDGLARKTYGFSGAQLADLLNEAAILAARRDGDAIGADDLHAGWLKVAVGTSRRRSMDERERSIIAAHEVGHAICGRVHGDKRKVEEISLFAHGEALGVTVSSQEDNDLPSESDLRARLVALMGGRAAEELLFQEVTAGASNDFEKANQIAVTMVTRFGMGRDPDASDLGTSGRGSLSFLVARPNGSLPSDVQAAATRAIRSILDEAYAVACETLVAHMDTLRRLAAYLVEHERVDGETFEAVFDGRIDVPNAAAEWRPETARPRAWGDIVPFRDRRFSRPRIVAPAVPRVAAVAAVDAGPDAEIDDGLVSASAVADAVPAAAPVTLPAQPTLPPSTVASPGDERVTVAAPPPPVVAPSATVRRRPGGGVAILRRRARRLASGALLAVEARIRPPEEARP